jgi:Ni/Fe-hydrogenase subunit HybB-like protein
MSRRLTALKTVLWALVGTLTVLTVARFTRGLGAVTNLSDAAPWGIWIALDVMAGVALAAGGFVMAGTVYIFGREKYRPLVRPAILTAFVGYVAVAIGLIYDLGLPWHIWHPMIYWQHHSVLFEVAMCVMTYLAVLALEFSPVVLEHPSLSHPAFRALLRVLRRVTIPLVIAGIVLSTLHQSSLGSLFLITPHRLHALWYSPIIYLLFFVSAVALGMMMVALETLLSSFFFGHKVHRDLLSGLGAATSLVLALYIVLRVGDLAIRGVLPSGLDGSWQSILFVLEMLVSAVLPALLLSIRRVRTTTAGMATCASATVIGMVWNRFDVAIVAMSRPEGMRYYPSWMEVMVTLGITAAAVLAFLSLVERLKVYDERVRVKPGRPSFDRASLHMMAPPRIASLCRYSLAFVIAAALTVLVLPRQAVMGVRPANTPSAAVRAVAGVVAERGPGHVSRLDVALPGELLPAAAGDETRRLLMINGNRNDNLVLFDHQAHLARVSPHQHAARPGHSVLRLPPGHVRVDRDFQPRISREQTGRKRGLREVPRGFLRRRDARDGDGVLALPPGTASGERGDQGARSAVGSGRRLHGCHARPVHYVPRKGGQGGTGQAERESASLRHLPQRGLRRAGSPSDSKR